MSDGIIRVINREKSLEKKGKNKSDINKGKGLKEIKRKNKDFHLLHSQTSFITKYLSY